MKAVITRDLALAFRAGGGFGLALAFFLITVTLVPIGVGPDSETLRLIAPGILWIGALLSCLLSLDRIFRGTPSWGAGGERDAGTPGKAWGGRLGWGVGRREAERRGSGGSSPEAGGGPVRAGHGRRRRRWRDDSRWRGVWGGGFVVRFGSLTGGGLEGADIGRVSGKYRAGVRWRVPVR